MTDKKDPTDAPATEKPESIEVHIKPFHAQSAGAAIRQFKEHGDMWDGYISMAMMMVYLNATNNIPVQAGFKNLYTAYATVCADPDHIQEVLSIIDKELLDATAPSIILQ